MESDAERNEIRGDQDDDEQEALCARPGPGEMAGEMYEGHWRQRQQCEHHESFVNRRAMPVPHTGDGQRAERRQPGHRGEHANRTLGQRRRRHIRCRREIAAQIESASGPGDGRPVPQSDDRECQHGTDESQTSVKARSPGRHEHRLREKQHEPCAADEAVDDDERREARVAPGLIDEGRSERDRAENDDDCARADIERAPGCRTRAADG